MFRFRNRRTGAMRTLYGSTAVLAVAVLAMVGWTTISAGAAAGAATSASKPPLCASSAVEVTATTNRSAYSPGQIVKLKSSATNVSATACSLWPIPSSGSRARGWRAMGISNSPSRRNTRARAYPSSKART